MNTFIRFFFEFVSIFMDGMKMMLRGFADGFKQVVNIKGYMEIINNYKEGFNGPEWVFTVFAIAILLVIFGLVFAILFIGLKGKFRFGKKKLNQDELLDEIADLNSQVLKLSKQNDELMAMKVSQLGIKPDAEEVPGTGGGSKKGGSDEEEDPNEANQGIRFPNCTMIDEKFELVKPKNYGNDFDLEQLLDDFRCYAASQLHLYYDPVLLRPFIAGLACGKLIILQGISGTGKTSLAYAWGKFVNNDSCVAAVQPSWRDKTEFLGYFNEFTKKFNESESLVEMYTATYDDNVHTLILDEMNIARVEYYFAEMLSILEMPSRDKWVIELVASGWPRDPKKIVNGKFKLPGNLWYIGTINNDDSTFMVTDKVYDRAMPIDINDKGQVFEAEDTPPMDINFSYVDRLFMQAREEHPVSEDTWKKIYEMDDFVIQHFRVAFGNRIVSHLGKFVSAYVACGGDEVEGVDYFIAKKILRKFEQLNIAYIKDEIDGFVTFLDKTFGKGKMKECIEYVLRLKKLG